MELLILAPAARDWVDIDGSTTEIVECIHIILDQLDICMITCRMDSAGPA